MSGLVIDHGSPWYQSPHVWATPTDAPDGPSPGVLHPTVGENYYLKANVRNTDISQASGYVDFYVANPSTTIARSTSTKIGTANVTVDAQQTIDVLCLTPWKPSVFNQGHECLVAIVVQPGDKPTDVLDGLNNPRVAQHNLTVIVALHLRNLKGSFHHTFQICNTGRKEAIFNVNAQQARSQEFEALVRLYGNQLGKVTEGKVSTLGFVKSLFPTEEELKDAVPQIDKLVLAPHSCTAYSIIGQLQGEAALVHIVQTLENQPVGGLSVLVLDRQEILQ